MGPEIYLRIRYGSHTEARPESTASHPAEVALNLPRDFIFWAAIEQAM